MTIGVPRPTRSLLLATMRWVWTAPIEDDEREDDDNPDVVARDAVAADENEEEHDLGDRAARRRR